MPYNNVQVGTIEKCIKLKGKTGGSVGEILSVGYAFLSTLFNNAENHRLAFVVDSSANPIDLEVRSKIGELLPKLTGQFIAFVISSEPKGFVDYLGNSLDEKETIHKSISKLIQFESETWLSKEGLQEFNRYIHGGYEVLLDWFDDRPRSVDTFLRGLQKKISEPDFSLIPN